MKSFNENYQKNNSHGGKILLGLLPFWTPLIPPMGISCLKSFLQEHGYTVSTIDLNIVEEFKDIYDRYFAALTRSIPAEKRGNFYNIGHDLLQNHLTAHFNSAGETEYVELVQMLVEKIFHISIAPGPVIELNDIAADFFNYLETYFLDLLEREKPSVLGLSVFRGTIAASLFVLKLTREKYPHIKTVMGGGIFSQEFDEGSENLNFFLERTPYIDNIIIGEGELLFLKLLQNKLPASKRFYTLKDIDNETLNISEAGNVDFSDFDTLRYPYIGAYTSRSCPFQCSFCAETTYWGKYRKKDAGQVVEELQDLFDRHNYPLFLMCDSLLNPIISDLSRRLLETDTPFYWDGYLRADKHACDEEETLLWRRGGFYRARIGVESGSPNVLNLMGKKISPRQIKDALAGLAEVGIKTTTYWVIGHPGETEADFQQTLDLIEEMKDFIYEAECNPFRYFESGQVSSGEWAANNKRVGLYPEKYREQLIFQTWYLDGEPTREETVARINRFVHHCRRLEIPNPYTLQEICEADERWKMLHKNAVPAFLDLSSGNVDENECRNIKRSRVLAGENRFKEEGGFNF